MKESQINKRISSREALQKHSIKTIHHQMANGELRFRLLKDDGTGYIRTEAGLKNSWQESHFHKKTSEIYIVQKGWVACATIMYDQLVIEVYKANEVFSVSPFIVHNIFMTKKSVIHTVKYGETIKEDRFTNTIETKKLDEAIKGISEKNIRK